MAPKRYPSQSLTRADIMARRIEKGQCDSCGGRAEDLTMWGRKVRACVNPDADHGFHEVGKRDGAGFSGARPSATVPADLLAS